MRPHNHLDGRRLLTPRDYLPAHRFGVALDALPQRPAGGDETSMWVAVVQHRLVCQYRALENAPSGAELARRWGFSRSVFSATVTGARWMGETVSAALYTAPAASTSGRGGAASASPTRLPFLPGQRRDGRRG